MTTMSAERTAALRSQSAVAEARQDARAFLEALAQPAIGREQADMVVLVVSELVRNALRHGGGAYTLRLAAHPAPGADPRPRRRDGWIRLAHGQRPRPPRRRHGRSRRRQDRPRPPPPVARRPVPAAWRARVRARTAGSRRGRPLSRSRTARRRGRPGGRRSAPRSVGTPGSLRGPRAVRLWRCGRRPPCSAGRGRSPSTRRGRGRTTRLSPTAARAYPLRCRPTPHPVRRKHCTVRPGGVQPGQARKLPMMVP